jgi:hypothetical protein
MILWLVILLFFIMSLLILIWKRNWKVFLLSLLPLIYVICDVYLECKATDNHSEACVWGYLSYLYAIVIGSVFYITVTLFQVVKSKVIKHKNGKSKNV